jgi:hypothetical protein
MPFLCFLLVLSSPAFAYTGPGMALGSVMAVLALVGGLLLLVVGTLWYPVKRVITSWRRPKAAQTTEQQPPHS